jgi:prevent-host-death family protein
MSIPAAVFKAECLRLMDEVARTGQPIVITKHGKPVAQLVPVPAEPESLFGYMSNTVTIRGDVVAPTGESWNADSAEHEPLGPAARQKSRVRRAGLKK